MISEKLEGGAEYCLGFLVAVVKYSDRTNKGGTICPSSQLKVQLISALEVQAEGR